MTTVVCEAILTRDYTLDGATTLTTEDLANYLAVLVRLAAVDGVATAEAAFVRRAAASVGLLPDLADIAGRFVADPSLSSEALIARIQDPGLRVCLLRDAYRLAAADGVLTEPEIAELHHIAGALGIPHGLASEVRSIALQESRLHRAFAELVRGARG